MSMITGRYNSTPITVTNTNISELQVDVNGYLKVNATGAAGSDEIQGKLAHDAADTGIKPIKIGAKARTSQLAAVAQDDICDIVVNQYGELVIAGYDWTSNALRIVETDPINKKHASDTLADVTDGADGTYYYYYDMEDYRKSGLQTIIDGGSGTNTTTIEMTLQNDGTAESSCTYQDVTNDLFGSASFTTSQMLIDNAEITALAKYVRVKIIANTTGADDSDWTIFLHKLY